MGVGRSCQVLAAMVSIDKEKTEDGSAVAVEPWGYEGVLTRVAARGRDCLLKDNTGWTFRLRGAGDARERSADVVHSIYQSVQEVDEVGTDGAEHVLRRRARRVAREFITNDEPAPRGR